MAEIIRFIGERESKNYHMPAEELVDKREIDKVYEAVGERLMWCYEVEGEIPAPGSFLVELYPGQAVIFSYGKSVALEVIDII